MGATKPKANQKWTIQRNWQHSTTQRQPKQHNMCLDTTSAGFRTNEAPYLGPEGGRQSRPTQAVRHTCSGNLGIVKILRYIRSDMYTGSATNSKLLYITQSPTRPTLSYTDNMMK